MFTKWVQMNTTGIMQSLRLEICRVKIASQNNQTFPNNPVTFLSAGSITFCNDSFKPPLPSNLGLLPPLPNSGSWDKHDYCTENVETIPRTPLRPSRNQTCSSLQSCPWPSRAGPSHLLDFAIPAFKELVLLPLSLVSSPHQFLHLPSVFRLARTSMPFPPLGTH